MWMGGTKVAGDRSVRLKSELRVEEGEETFETK